MSRNLPIKRSLKQSLIISAVLDFYGDGGDKIQKRDSKNIALILMNRKKGVSLTEEQEIDLWFIEKNLEDRVYTNNLLATPS